MPSSIDVYNSWNVSLSFLCSLINKSQESWVIIVRNRKEKTLYPHHANVSLPFVDEQQSSRTACHLLLFTPGMKDNYCLLGEYSFILNQIINIANINTRNKLLLLLKISG